MGNVFVQILCSATGAAAIVALINAVADLIKTKMNKDSVSLEDVKASVDNTLETFDQHKRETKESIDLLKRSQMEFMRERIKTICRKKIVDGHITSDELEDLTALHASYKELGGNGFCDKLMNKVNELEIR